MSLAVTLMLALAQSATSAQVIGGDDGQACYRAAAAFTAGREDVAACERAVVDVRLSQTDRAASFVNYGVALRKRGRTQAALAAYDRALVIAPELAEAWLNRSAALAALDRDEEALSAVNRALTLNLATPQIALVNRALILERRGEAQAAYTDLRAALELDPAYAPALLALERYEVADE